VYLIACIVFAVVSLVLGILGFQEISAFGFPDGHLTAYQRAAITPLKVVLSLYFVAGFGFGWCALKRTRPDARRYLLLMLMAFFVILMAAEWAIPLYFSEYQGLDRGRGG
jgi:hypothetical protein